MTEKTRIPEFAVNDVKRFFQWILGCTYVKKTIRTRISEMFHFAEAPHIVVYERNEENPWWWTVGVITAVLIGVLSVYYTLESIVRAIRKFIVNLYREPQSTVSTPRCLSPVKSSTKIISPEAPQTPANSVRQRVQMNEPVNCVFIRPPNAKPASGSPKIVIPTLNSDEDHMDTETIPIPIPERPKESKKEKKKSPQQPAQRLEDAEFTAGSNLNIRPTMVASPNVIMKNPPRKSSGSDSSSITNSSVSVGMNEWVEKQLSGLKMSPTEDPSNTGVAEVFEQAESVSRSYSHGADTLEPAEILPLSNPSRSDVMDPRKPISRSNAGGADVLERIEPLPVPEDFMENIQELINTLFNTENSPVAGTDTSNENISEMSSVPPTSQLSIKEVYSSNPCSSLPVSNFEINSVGIGKEATGNEESADIILEDSAMMAESENECSGSILVANGPQKVLFRWTDDEPLSVDSVTITGSFFGWNMDLPMHRTGEKTFEICVELPEGMHDYMIRVFRFE